MFCKKFYMPIMNKPVILIFSELIDKLFEEKIKEKT